MKMSKQLFAIVLIGLFFSTGLAAQDQSKEFKRTISVTGEAEKKVLPDIIYFNITLKEYQLKTGSKISIDELEKQLSTAVKKAGIRPDDLTLQNVYGYNHWWNKENENKDFMARKQFQLKLADSERINQILASLDPKGIENVSIAQYTHSKIDALNKQLKIEAIKNAKEKAIYLLAALDEEPGRVISISENTQGYQPVYKYQSSVMRTMDAGNGGSDIGFQKIELQSEVNVVFEIKE